MCALAGCAISPKSDSSRSAIGVIVIARMDRLRTWAHRKGESEGEGGVGGLCQTCMGRHHASILTTESHTHSLTYNAGWPQREAVVGARSSVMLTVFLQLFFTLTQTEGGRSDGALRWGWVRSGHERTSNTKSPSLIRKSCTKKFESTLWSDEHPRLKSPGAQQHQKNPLGLASPPSRFCCAISTRQF